MKAGSGFFYHRYGLKLRGGAGGNARSDRGVLEGFLIRVDGGYGCVQPWPELGDGSMEDQWRALRGGPMTPLLERALACAAADGAARTEGRSLLEGLAVPRSHATVTGEADFASLKAEGFELVKLKGGREWREVLDRMRRAAAAGLRVRVDFNGTLDEAGFLDFRRAAEDVRDAVDFVEDPVPYDAEVWGRLRRETGWRLALDRGAEMSGEAGEWDVRVVKPALEAVVGLGAEGKPVIFTSCMDHPLGQVFAAWEAGRHGGRQEVAGLLTHRLFEEDAFTERLSGWGPEWSGPGGTGLGFDDLLERLPWVPGPSRQGLIGRAGGCAALGGGGGVVLANPRDPLPEGGPLLEAGEVGFATSGSTGIPSVVVHSDESLEISAAGVNEWLGAGAADVWLRVLPAFHVGGWQIHRRAALAASRVVVDEGKWDVARFLKICQEEAVTLVSLVPTQVVDVVRQGLRGPAGMRAVVVGGGALEGEVKSLATALGWPVVRSYGASEAGSMVAAERVPGGDSSIGDFMDVLPHWQAMVEEGAGMDEAPAAGPGDGENMSGGREGVLCLRGGALAAGRFLWREGRWDRVELAGADGWWRTSDRVELRGRRLVFEGRVDRVVKVLGELVNLDAVEAGLRAAGLEAGGFVVVAMPEARAGFELVLVVERDGADSGAVERAMAGHAEKAPPFARVRRVAFLEKLPRSALGKVRLGEVVLLVRAAWRKD